AADRVQPARAPAQAEGEHDHRGGGHAPPQPHRERHAWHLRWDQKSGTGRPSLRAESSASVVPGVETFTARMLPSPKANWTTPGCQLPNWPANVSLTPNASGNDVPAL